MWDTWTQHDRLVLWMRAMQEAQAWPALSRPEVETASRRQATRKRQPVRKLQATKAPRYFTP